MQFLRHALISTVFLGCPLIADEILPAIFLGPEHFYGFFKNNQEESVEDVLDSEIGSRTCDPNTTNLVLEERLQEERPSPRLNDLHLGRLGDHRLLALGTLEDPVLTLQDGSQWNVLPADAADIYSWKTGDPLVISPHYSWFGSGNYYVTNQTSGSSVQADLRSGSIAYGTDSHWVVFLDFKRGHVTLEDGSTWCVCACDAALFLNWKMNDHIILGRYHTRFSPYDHILINVQMNSHVRTERY